ncbi:histidinol dehydrogenase, partial [Candidatus Saccharibacteria bacterium]|nr:histidinol dehydrogenase [Candidatus Saccharibacteria bacterium]
MKTVINPSPDIWSELCQRPSVDSSRLGKTVEDIFQQVQEGGDAALLATTKRYDAVELQRCDMPLRSAEDEGELLEYELRMAVDIAYRNIELFHRAQLSAISSKVETEPGVVCWREPRPIERVGLYVPGGTAPLLSTMLMLGIPAQLAGCKEIVVCTPPAKDSSVAQVIRYAAAKCGIETLYTVGGAQAIAAMTFGTETVPRVDKLFGPGNQYVTAAKQRAVASGVAIDMPAGPSEVMVIADVSANPAFVAADLLSQAEHGPDSQVVLLTTSRELQRAVELEVRRQLDTLPRAAIARTALKTSLSVYFDRLSQCVGFANVYAPEHLILQTKNAARLAKDIVNAGSVFLGPYTPESAGDYASGTNHTLPTSGWAKTYGGLSVEDYQKMVSFQTITRDGLTRLADTITTLAVAEGL